MNQMCRNCGLGLKPDDCSEHEKVECEFKEALKNYVSKFGAKSVIEVVEPLLNDLEKKNAIKYLLDNLR